MIALPGEEGLVMPQTRRRRSGLWAAVVVAAAIAAAPAVRAAPAPAAVKADQYIAKGDLKAAAVTNIAAAREIFISESRWSRPIHRLRPERRENR